MDKDSNTIERKDGTETRMTAFQRAMTEKDGVKAPSSPIAPTPQVSPLPYREQAREQRAREQVRPIPLTPPEQPRRAQATQGAPGDAQAPSEPIRAQRTQDLAKKQTTGSFAPVSVPRHKPATTHPARPAVKRRTGEETKVLQRPVPAGQAPAEKKQHSRSSGFFGRDDDGYVQSRFGRGRRIALAVFALASIVALLLCTWGSYSVSGLSIRENSQNALANKSDSKAYRIVYSPEDAFGADAAASLQSQLFAKTGATLEIVPDTESPSKNEIRIGYTKRAPDSYITSIGSLGRNGYAIIFGAGGGVDLIAFSSIGAEAAIMCFTDGYGVSYLAGNLNFASSSNLAYVSRDGTEPDTSLYESKLTLGFGSDGKFKMMVFSDTDINTNTISALEAMLDAERPDLVILNGDVSSGIST